jgi:hypothetical protein
MNGIPIVNEMNEPVIGRSYKFYNQMVLACVLIDGLCLIRGYSE